MKDTLIVVSTCNRRDLTGITLDSIAFNKHPDTEVLIVDDHSANYLPEHIHDWWGYEVVATGTPEGVPVSNRVGLTAKARLMEFLKTDKEFLIALDNDLLVSWRFDCKLRSLVRQFDSDGQFNLVTGYIGQPPLEKHSDWFRMAGCSGISHAMSRRVVEHLLEKIPDNQWGLEWDWRVNDNVDMAIAPTRSLVQHLGIYGTGVHFGKEHRAIDFVGDASFGGPDMRYYAQHGEDKWMDENWRRLELPERGVFAEVGVGNGTSISNTLWLENRGWSGLLIEPDPRNCVEIRKNRRAKLVPCAAGSVPDSPFYLADAPDLSGFHIAKRFQSGSVIQVPVKRLDAILMENGVTKMDVLSLDTEGSEMDIWSTFSASVYKPKVIFVEWNAIEHDAERNDPRNPNNQGIIAEIFRKDGYVVDCVLGANMVFVPESTYQVS